LTKKDLLSGRKSDLEDVESDHRHLTIISLISLGNLAAQDLKVADHVARTNVLRELIFTLSKDNTDQELKQQVSRLAASMSAHADLATNKRMQTQVGLEGLSLLLEDGDGSVQYNVARCLASMVRDRPFAKLVVDQDPLGWEIVENLSSSSSLSVQNQVARIVANIAATMGGTGLNKKPHLKDRLKQWTKSSNTTLSNNATRALASIMSDEASGAKYAEGVHLLYPRADKFIPDSTEVDLVFIHGVGGNPLTTWRSGTRDEGTTREGASSLRQ